MVLLLQGPKSALLRRKLKLRGLGLYASKGKRNFPLSFPHSGLEQIRVVEKKIKIKGFRLVRK